MPALGELPLIVAHADEPGGAVRRVGGRIGRARGQRRLNRLDARRLVGVAVDGHAVDARDQEVVVRVDEARHHAPPAQVRPHGVREAWLDLAERTNRRDASVFDRQGVAERELVVDGQDVGIEQNASRHAVPFRRSVG